MRFSTIATATALVGSAIAADHVVVVGNGSLTFEPDNVEAAEGDTVTFRFWPKNHSVAQGAFGSPCQPLDGGFWSGFVPVAQGRGETEFVYTVENASAPIWFYCTQGQHCQGGMVGAINAPTSGERTVAAYKSASENANSNVSPSSTAGEGGELTNSTGTTSPSGTASGGASPTGSGSAGSETGAASTLSGSMAFTGLMGMFAYLLM
ncbi:Cupredoxin [Corynespora cassiicola Philippines]|uniref:Cupredoxin n=1 Tax=Corynespora cassiicola Philippines TaxID=1448308 RepID=A0A2T2PAC7_CORCC|nr:Cupredoxin [Corynespora cassiicola Philippines]